MRASTKKIHPLRGTNFDDLLAQMTVALSDVSPSDEVTGLRLVMTKVFQNNDNASRLQKMLLSHGIGMKRLDIKYADDCSLELVTRARWQLTFPAGLWTKFLDSILGRQPVEVDGADIYTQVTNEIREKVRSLDSTQIPETLTIKAFTSKCFEHLVERLGEVNASRVKSIREMGPAGTIEKQMLSSITRVDIVDASETTATIKEFETVVVCRASAARGVVRLQWGLGGNQQHTSFGFQAIKTRKLICGNNADADIQISFPCVSREHLQLTPILSPEGSVTAICIEDTGSSNGTYERKGDGVVFIRKILHVGDSCALVLGCGREGQQSAQGTTITREFIRRCLNDPEILKSPTISFRVN